MPTIRSAQEADFIFEVDGFSGELRVLNFSGTEGVSELFEFGLHLTSEDGEIDIDSIVGKNATLTIFHDNGERKVQGIVSRFEQGSEGKDFTPYFAELVPEVWLLTQCYGCRIHQNLSVPDIVKKVLADAGIAADRFRFALSGNYDPRDYCVQYRESDWNFISRLLEEEGIFYFFEHTDEAAVLVMGDADTVHTPIEASDTVLFRDVSGTVGEEEAVFTYRYSQEIRPGKMTFRDYNFEKPTLNLEKDQSAARDDALEVYDYPGRYIEPDVGVRIAELRLHAVQSRRIIGLGESLVRRFIPGYKFTLDEHSRSDFNREYLLIWIRHEGTQPHGDASVEGEFKYNNDFRCIPADVPFRPTLRTRRPVVEGTQTAIVTGPSGEDIYPEKHSRVKVQFHWDREGQHDEHTSCWIRVAHGYAGNNHGIQFDPLIGDEVLVDFLEGNPDKPIIVGSVYNGDNAQKVDPKDIIQNIILTPYQHKLLFDDKGSSITLTTGGNETLNMADGKSSSANGNNIKLSTADGHYAHLAGGTSLDGIELKTKGAHVLRMDDKDTFVLLATTAGYTFILDDKKKNAALMTPGGHLIALDDENTKIEIRSGGMQEIVFDDASSTLKIHTGSNHMHMDSSATHIWRGANHISITDASIHLYNGGFHVLVDSGQIKLYNGGNAVRVAGDAITVSHSSKVELSAGGSKITISGAGVEISGPIVKINS